MRARSSEANGAGIDAVLDWIGVPAASVTVSTVNTVIASADPSLVTGLADKCLCEGNIQLSPVMTSCSCARVPNSCASIHAGHEYVLREESDRARAQE